MPAVEMYRIILSARSLPFGLVIEEIPTMTIPRNCTALLKETLGTGDQKQERKTYTRRKKRGQCTETARERTARCRISAGTARRKLNPIRACFIVSCPLAAARGPTGRIAGRMMNTAVRSMNIGSQYNQADSSGASPDRVRR